ncbi:unnamed protein product [Gongylonema pulchrum]|uniref:Transposase n=1 Tax=Gongylonema pulchrum TaxID=637853 RepID=A0A183DWV7_9BILA|nr:unnamed protein product [Gongylonema pulchrum]
MVQKLKQMSDERFALISVRLPLAIRNRCGDEAFYSQKSLDAAHAASCEYFHCWLLYAVKRCANPQQRKAWPGNNVHKRKAAWCFFLSSGLVLMREVSPL